MPASARRARPMAPMAATAPAEAARERLAPATADRCGASIASWSWRERRPRRVRRSRARVAHITFAPPPPPVRAGPRRRRPRRRSLPPRRRPAARSLLRGAGWRLRALAGGPSTIRRFRRIIAPHAPLASPDCDARAGRRAGDLVAGLRFADPGARSADAGCPRRSDLGRRRRLDDGGLERRA